MSRILWVEDAHEAIKALVRPLEKSGNRITAVRDVASAVERLKGGKKFDLVIVDLLLPLDKSSDSSVPSSIEASSSKGSTAGEALIEYMRRELGLKMPIIVLTVFAHTGQVRERLDPYEISGFYEKGPMTPSRLKELVERALNEPAPERAVLLDLRSKHPEERELGLEHLALLPPTPRSRAALLDLMENEDVPELQAKAVEVMRLYAEWEGDPDLSDEHRPTDDESSPKKDDLQEKETQDKDDQPPETSTESLLGSDETTAGPSPARADSRVLWLLVGIFGIIGAVILLNREVPEFTFAEIIILVVLAAVVTLGAMGVLFPDQVTKLLLAIINPIAAVIGRKKDDTSAREGAEEEESEPTDQ